MYLKGGREMDYSLEVIANSDSSGAMKSLQGILNSVLKSGIKSLLRWSATAKASVSLGGLHVLRRVP